MLHAENGFVAQCRRGFFATLTKRRLKRGVLRSLVHLQAAINRFLAEANDNPKPFVRTADPDKIIAAVRRGYQRLDSIHSHVRGCKMQARAFVAPLEALAPDSAGHGRRHGRQDDG
jgi:uncharacterized protein (DUF1786 family)